MAVYQDFKNAKLKDLQLHEKKGSYYLSAVYEYENESGVYELSIPKMKLNIGIPKIHTAATFKVGCAFDIYKLDNFITLANADIGFGDLPLGRVDGYTHKITIVKEKTRKMTLSEVEKKLGYKIELVSDKEE